MRNWVTVKWGGDHAVSAGMELERMVVAARTLLVAEVHLADILAGARAWLHLGRRASSAAVVLRRYCEDGTRGVVGDFEARLGDEVVCLRCVVWLESSWKVPEVTRKHLRCRQGSGLDAGISSPPHPCQYVVA